MMRKEGITEKTTELRLRAEEAARGYDALSPDRLKLMTPEDVRRMFHELRVHQIQLEMQNEELRETQQEINEVKARYFDLYDLAPVGYCTISDTGLILEANLTAASMLGVARGSLVKQPITRFILKEDQDIYYLYHNSIFEITTPQICELRMVKNDKTEFWAQLVSTAARDFEGSPVYRIVLTDISLKVAHRQLRNLSQHNERMREEERKRIARELHDTLGQLLTALRFDLLLLANEYRDNKELVSRIDSLDHISKNIIEAVEELSTKLRPAVLDKIGLKAAIEWLTDDFKRRNQIAFEFITNFEELDISQACSTAIFRIIQEALTNVVRHAEASSIKIILRKRRDRLHLLIEDNGKGFEKSIISSPESLGILGMRERAIFINGDLKIVSYPGKGTSINLTLPIIKE